MTKTVFLLALQVILFLYPMKSFSQQFNNEGMTYEVISKDLATAKIHKAHRCVQNFKVPYQVADYNGDFYRVTEIEYDAFHRLSCLYTLDLGDVQFIRDGYLRQYEDGAVDSFGAFANCLNLNAVTFGRLRVVGDYAFSGCLALASVDLTQVETVGDGAFFDCGTLQKVVLRKSVQTIGRDAFAKNFQIGRVEVYAELPPRCAEDAFSEEVYENAVLSVPKGKKVDYQQSEGWRHFLKIEESSLAGVEGMLVDASSARVHFRAGNIIVEGAAKGEKIFVYNAAGLLLRHTVSDGNTLSWPVGGGQVHWVKVGKRTFSGICL